MSGRQGGGGRLHRNTITPYSETKGVRDSSRASVTDEARAAVACADGQVGSRMAVQVAVGEHNSASAASRSGSAWEEIGGLIFEALRGFATATSWTRDPLAHHRDIVSSPQTEADEKQHATVSVWLYEQLAIRIEGKIRVRTNCTNALIWQTTDSWAGF
ncbi:hypothetical protein LIA77_00084 [Sarocladium implicatum]|nr:hypothetical protein LIA77_00084 [Sarocladium implicatum]